MIDRIHYMAWSVNREDFIFTMGDIINPMTGNPLATIDPDTGALVPDFGIAIDEIGPIIKHDENGEVIEVIPGHHANLFGYGDIILALTYGMPEEGDIFETTRILELVGAKMDYVPITEEGIPEGWQGTKMRLFDPANVATPARVWA
jgi:hypothetical protein